MIRAVLGAVMLLSALDVCAAAPQKPDFARDILPILRGHCFECHGEKKQEGDLRLDVRKAALDFPSAIVPGDAASSEIYRRTTLPPGDEEIMPAVGKPLTSRETELLRRWINAGAAWPESADLTKHWAYMTPVRPALPEVHYTKWARNGIDRF